MNVFALRKRIIDDYRGYGGSLISIADERINEHVHEELDDEVTSYAPQRLALRMTPRS